MKAIIAASRVWLEELAEWEVPLAGMRLFVVPRSLADRRPCGLLVVPPPGVVPLRTSRAEAYGRIGERLYLPGNARLEPHVTARELESHLLGEVAVFHPAAGLVAFESDDVLGVEDLLALPERRPAEWNRAQSGAAPFPRLLAVVAEAPAGLEQLLSDARDDIGTQAADDPPPAPGEPRSIVQGALGAAGRAMGFAAAHIVRALAALVPRTARNPTWINRLEDWASRKIGALRYALSAARERELNRLLHLLKTDPDEGLKFALPIDRAAHRGEGTPGGRLTRRDVNFNYRRLRGGGPADPWAIENEKLERLRTRYRELANREIALGRHRRAAYILAELLGDFAAAASALEQGGHFQEAALVYRHQLRKPLEAARCLERCAAWDEAVEIYGELAQFETAAELLARIDRPDEAARCYRRAVEQRLIGRQPLAAAALLEHKLHAPEEALALLRGQWPASDDAAECLAAAFELLGRMARHEQASAWIGELCVAPATGRAGDLARKLSQVAGTYPDPQVRLRAADATRVLAGGSLAQAGDPEAFVLVQAVRALVPEDDLLGRDVGRYLAHRSRRGCSIVTHRSAKLRVEQCGKEFSLADDVHWKRAVAGDNGFYAAGFSSRGVVLVRGDWNGALQRLDWPFAASSRFELVVEPALHPGQEVIVLLVGGPPLPMTRFPEHDAFTTNPEAGTPAWLPPATVYATYNEAGIVWTIDESLFVNGYYWKGGDWMGSRYLPVSEIASAGSSEPSAPPRPLLLARRQRLFVAYGDRLFTVFGEQSDSLSLPAPARRLIAGSPNAARQRIAVATTGFGGRFLWAGLGEQAAAEFAADLWQPEITFTLGGALVAIDRQKGEIVTTSDSRIIARSTFDGFGVRPAALVRDNEPNGFAVLAAGGLMTRFRLVGR